MYFALGQKDQAFAWLEKAYKQRSDSLLYLRCWPEFDRLRVDPRFAVWAFRNNSAVFVL